MNFIKLGEDISIEPKNVRSLNEILANNENIDRFTKLANAKTENEDYSFFVSTLYEVAKAKLNGSLNKFASVADVHLSEAEIAEQFTKIAKELKVIAPKANDFLYFTAIMMHAAEAALVDDNGQIKKHADGKPITAIWEKRETPKGTSWKWACSDPSIKSYKNKNGDIFPAIELKAAYKNWIGKPLCVDHQSSSVDHIRGVIVDTYWDESYQRIIALCALDKKNYPELARKVESGYSTNTSMGVAVGNAICFDCGTVAKVESDFCDCMKFKRCYGEINVGLNPIEFSIVVSGADPKSKIRKVIAEAGNIAQYIDQKEFHSNDQNQQVLNKLASLNKEIEELKKESNDLSIMGKLAHQIEDLSNKLNILISKENNSMANKQAYFQGGGGINEPTPGQVKYPKEESDKIRETQDKQMVGQMDTGPVDGMHPGYESFGESETERKRRLQRLADEQEQRKIKRLAALNKAKANLSKTSYFNGGGDVNEPSEPGKPKYPVDPTQEKLREKDDKQMVGQSPFPGVGNVDGLHPSPESADIKDELKRKEMLQRAEEKLQAKLIRTSKANGEVDPKTTRWEIYNPSNGNLVLNASLWDVAGEKYGFHYQDFASKDFAKKLMGKIRAEGAENVGKQLKKQAQAVAPAPQMLAPAPDAAMGDAGMPDAGAPMDMGGTGDPSAQVQKTLDEMEGLLADLRKAFETLNSPETHGEMDQFKDLTQTGQLPPNETQALAYENKLNKILRKAYKEKGKQTIDLIEDLKFAKETLDALHSSRKKLSATDQKDLFGIVKSALDEAKTILADCHVLNKSLVKYARGRQLMIKKAEMVSQRIKLAQDPTAGVPGRIYHKGDPFMPLDATPEVPYHPSSGSAATKPAPIRSNKPAMKPSATLQGKPSADEKLPAPYGDRSSLEKMLEGGAAATKGVGGPAKQMPNPHAGKQPISYDAGKPDAKPIGGNKADDGMDTNDLKMNKDGTMEGSPEELGKVMKEKSAFEFDLSSKEGRAQMRAKLAQKAVTFSDMLKVHKGGVVPGGFDTKPSGDLGKVETLEETHKAMMDLANMPPKIRKQAQEIANLVAQGKIDPKTDFPGLIANGVDAEAVKYYKSYFGQAKDGGSEFATELLKDHAKTKSAQEIEKVQVRVKRAYELACSMSDRGLLDGGMPAITKQAESFSGYTDKAFEEVQQFVMSQPVKKIASAIPQVGMMQSWNDNIAIPVGVNEDLTSQFAAAFNTGKKY